VNTEMVEALIPILGIAIGCPTMVFFALMIFPSTRAAFARRLAGRTASDLDERVLERLASTEAQISAMRGEVYALRGEVATIAQALPSASRVYELPGK
jgi:hypothetical protein